MGKIENGINREKKRVADWLQQQSGKASLRMQKVLLLLTVLFVALYCAILMLGSKHSGWAVDQVTHLKTGIHVEDVEILGSKVERLESYLYSLEANATGRMKRDSILRYHPGLLDSIETWKRTLETRNIKNRKMENINQLSEHEMKKKKFLLVLPMLVLPFITLGFWAMGGGQGPSMTSGNPEGVFNLELPDASGKDGMKDKLEFYERAERDSLRFLEMTRKDPYYQMPFADQDPDEQEGYDMDFSRYAMNESYQDPHERKVYEKLNELDAVLQGAGRNDGYLHTSGNSPDHYRQDHAGLKEDIERLEQMMLMMQSRSNEPDPEMEQINSVLSTVLDIQHPERVQERLRQNSQENRGQVFAVSAHKDPLPITTLEDEQIQLIDQVVNRVDDAEPVNRFYGLANIMADQREHNAIEAVVHETQTLVTGGTVKLRLLNDVYINGILIEKDNFVFGTANLQGERLAIEINHIRSDNAIFPVQLNVHDMDGLLGIHIPGSINRHVAKQNSTQAIQGMNMGMFNPSLGAQAASAGIELSRSLLSRNIKLIKVEVKAGYKVLLKDGKQRD